jgi:phosphotransferase system enzyme I (PtsP)
MSVPSLRALKMIVERAAKAECPVAVCGEMGGKPLDAMALIGLGYRSLSMSPAAIGPVKAMLLELDVGVLRQRLDELLVGGCIESLRPALASFAEQHGIPV